MGPKAPQEHSQEPTNPLLSLVATLGVAWRAPSLELGLQVYRELDRMGSLLWSGGSSW